MLVLTRNTTSFFYKIHVVHNVTNVATLHSLMHITLHIKFVGMLRNMYCNWKNLFVIFSVSDKIIAYLPSSFHCERRPNILKSSFLYFGAIHTHLFVEYKFLWKIKKWNVSAPMDNHVINMANREVVKKCNHLHNNYIKATSTLKKGYLWQVPTFFIVRWDWNIGESEDKKTLFSVLWHQSE